MDQKIIDESLTRFSPQDAAIAEMRELYLPLKVDGLEDAEGFKLVHQARMHVREKRVEVEKTRKELKADALQFGRAVDGEAKRITGLLRPIEDRLVEQERPIMEERERLKNAARLAEEEAERKAREEEEAKRNAALKAEEERLAEEKRKQDVALAQERRELAEQRAKQEAEREELERERASFDAARRKRENDLAYENARKAEEVAKKAAAERVERFKPDFEKIDDFLDQLQAVPVPEIYCRSEIVAEIVLASSRILALKQTVPA